MKTKLNIMLAILFLIMIALPVGILAQEMEVNDVVPRRIGIVFNVGNLLVDLVAEHSDGVQGGAGAKLWLNENTAARAILDLLYTSDSDLDLQIVSLGLSAAIERHFLEGRASPYFGVLAGVQGTIDSGESLAVYAAALLGVELALLENLALFAEYSLLVRYDNPVFEVDLGIGNNAQLGAIIYLN